MDQTIRGIVIAILALTLAGFLVVALGPARRCPKCQHPLPRFRRPRSLRELLWGGWHCPVCSTEVSRTGQFLN
jgi:hypothetical protein